MSDGKNGPQGINFGYAIYQQIASVVGAFALIAFLSHFWDVGWRGGLADLVGIWDQYVRPSTKWLSDRTIVTFLDWAFNWRIDLPLIVRDYLSVGIVLAFSTLRSGYILRRVDGETFILIHGKRSFGLRPRFVAERIAQLFVWPIVIFYIVKYLCSGPRLHRHSIQVAVGLSPILYLLLILAANYLLLKS